jgi:hypothetical protein
MVKKKKSNMIMALNIHQRFSSYVGSINDISSFHFHVDYDKGVTVHV